MKTSARHLYLITAIIAFFTALQSASATAYRFWQEGWPDGGVLYGTLEIDESQTMAGYPDICFYNALISFEAHWSGNSISQPYDWGIGEIGTGFRWYVPTHRIDTMAINIFSPVFVDGSILVDYRNEYTGGNLYWVQSSAPMHTEAVPDGGSTLGLLGLGLACLAPLRRRLNRAKA